MNIRRDSLIACIATYVFVAAVLIGCGDDSVAGTSGWVHLDGALAPGHEFTVEMRPIVATTELATRIWRAREYDALDTNYENFHEMITMGLGLWDHREATLSAFANEVSDAL